MTQFKLEIRHKDNGKQFRLVRAGGGSPNAKIACDWCKGDHMGNFLKENGYIRLQPGVYELPTGVDKRKSK